MIFITAPTHEIIFDLLKKNNLAYKYCPAITYDELFAKANKITGLIVTTRIKIDAQFIDKATSLTWIGRLGSGMELIDVEYAQSKNIKCVSSPEGNANAVGEHCMGLLLSLSKNLIKSHNEIKEGIYLRNENRGFELKGKTIGIIGYGHTGPAFAKCLQGFDVEILIYDKYKTIIETEKIKQTNIENICKNAHIISFHLPYNSETHHFCNNDFLNNCLQEPIIINTSRGAIANTNDLLKSLTENKISGIALDVLENEKLETYNSDEKNILNQLLSFQNTIITSHIAGYSNEASIKMVEVVLKKLGFSI